MYPLLHQRERFFRHVNKNGPVPQDYATLGKCWLWTGTRQVGGYGQFLVKFGVGNFKNDVAHRIAYRLERGPIAKGLTIDHLCRVRHCVNPWHMEVVTQRENTLRGNNCCAQNHRKTHCKRGHAFDKQNTYINNKGERHCRMCVRLHMRAFRKGEKLT